mmetsp:Transcript_119454/g.230461  ORF Transcript_119454/g.230461 Transcript_119454/m.230461 type:complete len:484 (-) Transcript_119454:166-1617(-)
MVVSAAVLPRVGVHPRMQSRVSEASYLSILEHEITDRNKKSSKLLSYHHLPASNEEELDCVQVPEWRSCFNTTTSSDIPGIKELSALVQVMTMCRSMIRVHGMGFVGIGCSFCICCLSGFEHASLVDGSFFKSTGLLLAVMLSLRVRNAVTRRTHLTNQIPSMINAAKTILDMAANSVPEKRRFLSQALGVSFADVALWLTRHCVEEYSESISVTKEWLADQLSRLPCEYRRQFLRLGGIGAMGVSPRPQLLYLRDVCDTLFTPEACGEIDKISNIRRWHKNIDRELQRLEVHTKEFRWLISALIFFYVALYPWFVADERKIILAMTTGMMAIVFYGLDAMAQELEEPLGPHSQGLNVALTFRQAFAEIEKEQEVRANFDQFLEHYEDERLSLDLIAEFASEQIRQQVERAKIRQQVERSYPPVFLEHQEDERLSLDIRAELPNLLASEQIRQQVERAHKPFEVRQQVEPSYQPVGLDLQEQV